MFDFSTGDYDNAIAKLKAVLAEDPSHFDAQLALGMAYYRKGDYAAAIAEGHKAEKLRPHEQLVHTNLSLFYMKAGDKGRPNITDCRRGSLRGGRTKTRPRRLRRIRTWTWRSRRRPRRRSRRKNFPICRGRKRKLRVEGPAVESRTL